MNVSKNEARDYLESVQAVQQRTREAIINGGAPFYLMLWGIVYLAGYLGNQYLSQETAKQLWTVSVVLGVGVSLAIGWVVSRSIRRPSFNVRVLLAGLAWWLYGYLLVGFSGASDGTSISLMWTVYTMFVYVLMGLWLWKPLAWIGISVTIVAVAAYLVLPAYVNLIMGWVGGSALFFSGIDLHRRWR